jgi:hypothetical protein
LLQINWDFCESVDFYGYKTEFSLITEERIITAVRVHDGAYVDGTAFKQLFDITKECGIDVKEVYADNACFSKPILDTIKRNQAQEKD